MTVEKTDLSWTTILVVVVGVSAATGMIVGAGWSVAETYTLLAVVAVALALLVIGVLLAITPRSEWGVMLIEAKRVMRDEFRALGKMTRRK